MVAGCSTADLVRPRGGEVTAFEALGDGTDRYAAVADASFPEGDADAEARRIDGSKATPTTRAPAAAATRWRRAARS